MRTKTRKKISTVMNTIQQISEQIIIRENLVLEKNAELKVERLTSSTFLGCYDYVK